ncbi:ABC transporter ATP-binding protein [Mogibacterium sp. NSJ-24]|uniref:ABC transporter ATP-binding protein n=1 Tax=Lentihominibacter hominis TaxID=2763645 RepID=A0A926I949_9FIRM|nr:ABC transporter ATP-binding protein [Lentihominibacter hominis]MBC8568801.1 ABC transporter ATP-binding protein [Lentihominibacter hominis]
MLKILRYLRKKDLGLIFISLLFIATQVWLDLKMPDYMSEITRLVQTEGSEMGEIMSAGGKMLLCAFGSLIAAMIVGFMVAKVAASLSMRLREKVYDKTMSFSMEEINGFSTASLITRSTNDITQIQMCVAIGLQAIIKAPIMAVWAVVKIAGKGWEWTAATGGAVIVLILMLGSVIALAMPKFKSIQKLTDSLNRVARENLTGLRVVRAYHAEDYQEARFEKANDDLTKNHLFTSRTMAFMQPGMQLIMSGLGLAIYWIGTYLIDGAAGPDKLTLFSDMVVFSQYAMQVVLAFMLLTMTFIILPRVIVSAKRINEVLDTKTKIHDGKVTDSELYEQGEVEFRHVSFQYPDAEEYILHDISFTAHKGETVAFIGSTGSGKSTLINLVPRFYDATEGEVIVDGINVKNYTQEALHNKLGYVPQKAVMFNGTVTSNVTYGENGRAPAEKDDIIEAVSVAQAEEFVMKMDGTYDAKIAQGGTNVSGGQKQRLAIARAICRRPEIYVFDDSFSALDYKTDRILRKKLKETTNGATSLIVAQRIGTIMDADKIIVLDEGRVVGQGTHRELLKNCPVYLEIAESQLTKEEIANA